MKPLLTARQEQTVRASMDLHEVMMTAMRQGIAATDHRVRRNAADNFRWSVANWWDCCEQVLADMRESIGASTAGAEWDNRRGRR